jgi:toxin ParE1/3/4
MSRIIRRTAQVREDIIGIYRYIHERSPQSADRILEAIEQSIRRLIHTPGTGRHWNSPDSRLHGLRITTVKSYRNYLIFFRAVSDGIEVFRIVHGARELEPLIDEIQIDFEEA